MYLKSVELAGFKSFAEKTRLEFEPGMTAIVGPNGCGKSNVSDAIRWVLGETRARALRGSTMEDCIFSGTDSSKPLGMAEVTLTLAECDEALDLGLNEISITRRVFRSGNSDYFINKKTCRRKDIQRLFMDTGIGTSAYSVIEQGKIDQILSSRPDERRAVFEEASGITKYRNDKQEALRKLEQTETNLLRLADVIREVKRQITSLQRQARKAQRYQEIYARLRAVDIYVTRDRLNALSKRIETIRNKLETAKTERDTAHREIDTANQASDTLRKELRQLELATGSAMDESMRLNNQLERAQHTIRTNDERINELDALAQQHAKEADTAKKNLTDLHDSLTEISAQIKSAETEKESAKSELEKAAARQNDVDKQIKTARQTLHQVSSDAAGFDQNINRLQNELSEIDTRERSNLLRTEQLALEKKSIESTLTSYKKRRIDILAEQEALQDALTARQARLTGLNDKKKSIAEQIQPLENELSELRQRLAGRKARLEMVHETRSEGYPPGATHLLENRPAGLIGPLAEQFNAAPGFETALGASLRPWMDSLVVSNRAGTRNILSQLSENDRGAVRLMAADAPRPHAVSVPGAIPLLSKISCTDAARPLAERLLAAVFVCDNLNEIPFPMPGGTVFVTKRGELLTSEGTAELWKPQDGDINPLGRHLLRKQLKAEILTLENSLAHHQLQLKTLQTEQVRIGSELETARTELDEQRRRLAVQEGEHQVIARELKQTQQKMETVTRELSLIKSNDDGESHRAEVAQKSIEMRDKLALAREQITVQTEALHALEELRATVLAEASECRIQHSQREQRLESLIGRQHPLEARRHELKELIKERTNGISSYQQRIEQLRTARQEAIQEIAPLEEGIETAETKLAESRKHRETKTAEHSAHEQNLRALQRKLENLQNDQTALEVEQTEHKMRHLNAVERITATYHITPEEIDEEPAPQWEDELPLPETVEAEAAELREKIAALGPVNLVAIEEHAELEERFTFLSRQQSDLIKAKALLLEMINKINETTTAMFSETFAQVNQSFGEIFKQLFGGGSAKLVLMDETNVLESGIEIIARPPGKKLQSISLLSGGERTMTAVGLLFALFKVKPSPFCVLDEMDAALDEANISRFVKMVESFLDQSQFLLITHSRQTIAAADVIYGVTMPTRGVSRIMSVKFADYQT